MLPVLINRVDRLDVIRISAAVNPIFLFPEISPSKYVNKSVPKLAKADTQRLAFSKEAIFAARIVSQKNSGGFSA